MTPSVDIRAMHPDDADLGRFQACFAENGFPRGIDMLRWQYLEAPDAQLLVDFAVEGDGNAEIVGGIYAVFPVDCIVGGTTRRGAQSLDTMTDARYRGRGLFVNLARSVYERCAAGGVAFVYGFPNGNSVHGFLTKLGWTSLDPVPFLVRPLRSRYFLSKVPLLGALLGALPDLRLPAPRSPQLRGDQSLTRVNQFGDEFTALWREFSRDIGVAVERDAAYLRWRFDRKPGEEYHTYAYHVSSRLAGFVTYCVKEKHGGRIGYVMELITAPTHPEGSRLLLRHALADLVARGADAVLVWNLEHSSTHAAFRGAGFLPLPERLRPIELHFGVRAFDPGVASAVADRRSWYLSYCDSDTV